MQVQKFPPKIQLKNVDDTTVEVFMSFGLLNRLTSMVGGSEGVLQLIGDPELQQAVVVEALTIRKKGEASEVPTLEDINLTLESIGDLIDWVGGHIQTFLLQRAEKATKMVADLTPAVSKLTATQNGLLDSISPKPAASPSPASPQN